MKNIKLWIVTGCLGLISLTSCFFEEKNIFDESSAQRMNDAMANYFDLLTSSPNGWALNYFPTDDQIGYTLLVNFNKDGSARIAAKNDITGNQYSESVSLFRMIADNGPVLTFDSYNDILHYFSDAGDIPGPRGLGMEGDYEFIVMQTSTDKIMLKGKKRGVYMNLVRLAEGQDWKDYFTILENMNNLMFNKNVPQIIMSVGDSIYTLDNGYSHIFVAVPKGGDPITQNEKIPFIVTDKGIMFSKTFTYNNDDIRVFNLSDDKNELVCVDEGVSAKITGPDLISYYFSSTDANNLRWIILSGQEYMSPSVQAIYNRIAQSFINVNTSLSQISIRNTSANGNLIYITTTKNQYGSLLFNREQISGGVKYMFKNAFGTGVDNGKAFYDKNDGVADLMTLLSSSFKIDYVNTVSQLRPTLVKLTDISNPDVWFVLQVQ